MDWSAKRSGGTVQQDIGRRGYISGVEWNGIGKRVEGNWKKGGGE